MKILVACEESQAVTIAMRQLGHEAYSCDILPPSGGHPEWHMQEDVRNVLGNDWDMIIAFPPCTHLASSGAKHFKQKQLDGRQAQAIDFFLEFTKVSCPKVAIENPIGIMSTIYRKPDQIISPSMFGHLIEKKTCLWLRGLPKLRSSSQLSNLVPSVEFSSGKRMSEWYYQTSCLPHDKRAAARSKTFWGVAEAMARQWTIETN